jgi:hypothetical protein
MGRWSYDAWSFPVTTGRHATRHDVDVMTEFVSDSGDNFQPFQTFSVLPTM